MCFEILSRFVQAFYRFEEKKQALCISSKDCTFLSPDEGRPSVDQLPFDTEYLPEYAKYADFREYAYLLKESTTGSVVPCGLNVSGMFCSMGHCHYLFLPLLVLDFTHHL